MPKTSDMRGEIEKILWGIRQYEMDCGCVEENCSKCAIVVKQATNVILALIQKPRIDEDLLRKLDNTLCNVAQIFDGWHTDIAWTEYDESIRKEVSECMSAIAKELGGEN